MAALLAECTGGIAACSVYILCAAWVLRGMDGRAKEYSKRPGHHDGSKLQNFLVKMFWQNMVRPL